MKPELEANNGQRQPALSPASVLGDCPECGGSHERTGARTDCIRHWKLRALQAENKVLVEKIYGGVLGCELRQWLDEQIITSENIGDIRRRLFVPWGSEWNALVRDETASRENKSPNESSSATGRAKRREENKYGKFKTTTKANGQSPFAAAPC